MSDIKFTIDGVEVGANRGQTIMEAADDAGIYIPRLCYLKGFISSGSCRVCTVLVNGRPQAACTQPAAEGMRVVNSSPELLDQRRSIVEMLFVEGNHYCPFCEKSGNCELQAMGYRLGIMAPRHQYLFPKRDVDASHPDIIIDRNRCIDCGRCVRASRQADGKAVFGFVGRSIQKQLAVDSATDLAATDAQVTDRAVGVCPVGALMKKRVGFAVPYGQRMYDQKPIGSDIESKSPAK